MTLSDISLAVQVSITGCGTCCNLAMASNWLLITFMPEKEYAYEIQLKILKVKKETEYKGMLNHIIQK